MAASKIPIPKSVRHEHGAIKSVLLLALHEPGDVGAAARALSDVLHPHFLREEEIALPPLGLVAPLASGAPVPETELAAALEMTDALKREMPRMLEEHKAIHAAVERLRLAAQAAKATRFEHLAEELAQHALTEEEVLYPAAILVGELIRARGHGK